MAAGRKNLRSIKTMGRLMDRRRARTPAGALLEIASLAYEKERLNKELAAGRRRQGEIEQHLLDIADKEIFLQAFIKNQELPRPSNTTNADTPDLPRFKKQGLRY